jgi:hypothetical protein
MKNLHVLPTDKPSRVYKHLGRELKHTVRYFEQKGLLCINQNIYITSDEKFVRDEYVTDGIEVIKATPKLVNAQGLVSRRNWRKIILTIDQDLIADGIQAIDDIFLEWFVENPSCESVEVKYQYWKEIKDVGKYTYKIIIPKEEDKQEFHICKYCGVETTQPDDECYAKPKQETLEEAAERYASHSLKEERQKDLTMGFIEGAKWQAERMYSEEEVQLILSKLLTDIKNGNAGNSVEWFEQFKKNGGDK